MAAIANLLLMITIIITAMSQKDLIEKISNPGGKYREVTVK
jgi:hypothetical protein